MRHRAIAAAMGLATAALFAAGSQSQAASADPSGYWMKPDAERESKILVFKCGKDKKLLCAKLVWLKDPVDSKGNPLTDIRNENPSMRGRQIVGLAIFSGLTPSAPSTWTGKIYNPEDGQTYSATLTVLSRTKILLKGCKAWLLCGERQWYRTAAPEELAPTSPAEGTQQIEASVTPPLPKPQIAVAAAPSAEPASEALEQAPAPQDEIAAAIHANVPAETPRVVAMPVSLVSEANAAPLPHPADGHRGYRFLSVAPSDVTPTNLTNENVPGLFAMANCAVDEIAARQDGTEATAAIETGEAIPRPEQKPKSPPKAVAAAATAPKPAPKQAAATTAGQAAPVPQETGATQSTAQAATADASMAEDALTRRQKRLLRRQQQQHEPFLPWLR
jgi:uncharacterized protein (DUF2147 family)